MCILPHTTVSVPVPVAVTTPATPTPAHALSPQARQQLAVDALAGHSITQLADQHQVSRKFVYQQQQRAQVALAQAFAPTPADDTVLFHLPVTRSWLRQLTLGLVLI